MDGVQSTDPQYFDLLMNELKFLRPRTDSIKTRCAVIREVKVNGANKPQMTEKTKNFCLDLAALEAIYRTYKELDQW